VSHPPKKALWAQSPLPTRTPELGYSDGGKEFRDNPKPTSSSSIPNHQNRGIAMAFVIAKNKSILTIDKHTGTSERMPGAFAEGKTEEQIANCLSAIFGIEKIDGKLQRIAGFGIEEDRSSTRRSNARKVAEEVEGRGLNTAPYCIA
jgi:hypothetical protein